MRYQTELMRSILTNEQAQKIIDYVSPIYGDSYIALWIYQVMGIILGEVYDIASQLRYETSPATADLLLEYWERHYAVAVDSSLPKEQRRARLASVTSARGPCNPAKLEAAISVALGGVKVEITENIAKNTFLVNIREAVEDFTPAVAVLERMKQAHLIYQMRVATQNVSDADLKVAVAVVHAEMYKVEVKTISETPTLTMDSNGVLIGTTNPTMLEDGTLIFSPMLNLSDDGILSY